MKDWQGRAGGVAGRRGTGSQAALGEGEDRVQPVGSTTGRRWPGGTPGEQDPAARGHRGSHALHTHAARLILTGACTHWHSAHTHTHTPPHTHTHPVPRPRLQAATALRRGTVAKDSRGGHCPGGGSGGPSGL